MEKRVLIIISEGFEEMEAVGPIDVLRRAGLAVTVASREDHLEVTGRNAITIRTDALLDSVLDREYALVVLPGGPGHTRMLQDERILSLVREQVVAGRLVGAICAAPLVLLEAGVLSGRQLTAHSSTNDRLPGLDPNAPVVEDEMIITSRGAGTAARFALTLVRRLCGAEKAKVIAQSIHLDTGGVISLESL